MELTNSEKKIILSQHIKNIRTNIYNLEISLIAETAVESPDQDIVNNLNNQIAKEQVKKEALLEQYAQLNTEEQNA